MTRQDVRSPLVLRRVLIILLGIRRVVLRLVPIFIRGKE